MARQLPCSTGLLRVMSLVLNIVFVLIGITVIVLGIYIKIDSHVSTILDRLDAASNFEGTSLSVLAGIMISGGAIILVIAIIGCMGSLWQSRRLLIAYSTSLAILMVFLLVGLILALAFKSKLETVYKDRLFNVLTKALNTEDIGVLDDFGDLEKSLNCCGVNGINDYHGRDPRNPECYRYRTGCSPPLIDMFNGTIPTISITLGLVLFFQLLCLINNILLAITLKKPGALSFSPTARDPLINKNAIHMKDYYDHE